MPAVSEEVNFVYEFLLELYLDKVFKEYGSQKYGEPVSKKLVQDRFNSFCGRKCVKARVSIETMLVRNDFSQTSHDNKNIIVIKTWTFMQIHKKWIKQKEDALIKENSPKNRQPSSEENIEKLKQEKVIFNFLMQLFNCGKLNINSCGFYVLNKKLADESFKNYCISNGLLVTKLVSMLRAHGYLQHVETKEITIQSNTFLRKFEQFKVDQKSAGLSQRTTSKVDISSSSESEIDKSFSKVDLECHLAHYHEDMMFKDWKLGCFICQDSFRDRVDFNRHRKQHKDLNIEYEESVLTVMDIFKVYYYISKSKDFIFAIKTDIEGIILNRVIFVTEDFHYPIEEATEMQRGKEIKFLLKRCIFRPEEVYPMVISYKYKEADESKIFFQEQLFIVEPFYYNKATRDNEFFWTTLIPEEDLPFGKLMKPTFDREEELKRIFKKCRIFSDLKEKLMIFSNHMKNYLICNNHLSRENFVYVNKILLKLEEFLIDEEYEKLSKRDSIVKITQEPLDPDRKGSAENSTLFSITLKNLPKETGLDVLLQAHDILELSDIASNDSFVCFVKEIDGNKVLFNHNLSSKSKAVKTLNLNNRYRVKFLPNKIQLEYQYRSLSLVTDKFKKYLFPDIERTISKPTDLIPVTHLFQKNLSEEQKEAVSNIVGNKWNNSSPYLLFGPPGTGKTMTIVESVLQILKNSKSDKILITVNSNAACDEIGKRLKKFIHFFNNPNTFLRIYSAAHVANISNWDDDFLKISNLCHGYHYYPTLNTVKQFRVIIATSVVSAKYIQSGLGEDSFSHIFIDENASNTIPEALLGLAGVWTPKTKVILSGDPRQLGAVLRNSFTEKMGLGVSLMERLMDNLMYHENNKKEYDRLIQTRLTTNYRSHPEILDLFNNLFYKGTLNTHFSSNGNFKINSALNWHLLKKPKIPIIFHNTYKPSTREAYETSMCNLSEIDRVFEYVRELIFFGLKGQPVQQEDIGIVAPYRKQCLIIRTELDRRGWTAILVGAPEIFQGQEKPIIIASVVRSETDTVGFLRNFRRLNVIISRAESLLIIIGNDRTLQMDQFWRQLIEMCKEKGVFLKPHQNNYIEHYNFSKKSVYQVKNLKMKVREEKF